MSKKAKETKGLNTQHDLSKPQLSVGFANPCFPVVRGHGQLYIPIKVTQAGICH